MTNILIDEAINGYIVSIYNSNHYGRYTEICERKIDALQIVLNYVNRECEKEVKLIQEGGRL